MDNKVWHGNAHEIEKEDARDEALEEWRQDGPQKAQGGARISLFQAVINKIIDYVAVPKSRF